ncbi:hypothetical protein [Verrucomicrobium sp. BvORR034]|uniref:hypothetical protein n=1 Tax=Verrucomicrobium sp. BvORR034 TaxID=1396418 RepID=UPI000678F100|nr:hypothetical protein [Verrucomicrobium sp. BvORR034]
MSRLYPNLEPLTAGDPVEDFFSEDRMSAIESAARSSITSDSVRGGPGVFIGRSGNSVRIRVRSARRVAGAAAAEHPYKVTVEPASGTMAVTVQDANFGALVPTIGGVPISAGPSLTVSATGTYHIHLKATFTLVKNDDETVVTGGALVSAAIDSYADGEPSPGAGEAYVRLATIINGVSSGSVRRTSLEWKICDDGSGTGTAEVKIGPA